MTQTATGAPSGPAPAPAPDGAPAGAEPGKVRRLLTRTGVRAWDDNIFSEAAAAAFWQTLSLPPLLLGIFGILSYVGDWFGPGTIQAVQEQIVQLTGGVFSREAVEEIIAPTVADILTTARAELISVGFIISLWSGSSAMSSFVDAITRAHDQYLIRNPVWQRTLALLMYVVGLLTGIVALPIAAIGPAQFTHLLPDRWEPAAVDVVSALYLPVIGVVLVVALTTLYKVALPLKPPWWRGLPGALLAAAVFLAGATGLRVYLDWLTGTGYTYGALAAPIAFLLATFFIGLAIVLGAHLNAGVQALWPTSLHDRRGRLRKEARCEQDAPGLVPHPDAAEGAPDVERAVRDRPEIAAATLERLGYRVAPPPDATPDAAPGPPPATAPGTATGAAPDPPRGDPPDAPAAPADGPRAGPAG